MHQDDERRRRRQVISTGPQQSALVARLLKEGRAAQPERIFSTTEGLARVGSRLVGAFAQKRQLDRQTEARELEAEQQRKFIGSAADLIARGEAPPLAAGQFGPGTPTQAQSAASLAGRAMTPQQQSLALELTQQFAQQQQAAPQFSNVQFDERGNAIGLNAQGQVQRIPQAGQGLTAPVRPEQAFGAAEQRRKAEALTFERGESRRDFTSDLRKEVRTISGPFNKQAAAIERMRVVSRDKEGNILQTPAASLALVFNFMNILDPGVSVRADDFRNVESAVGLVTRSEEAGTPLPTPVVQLIQRIAGQGFLTENQITDLTARGEDIFNSAKRVNLQELSPVIESAISNGTPLDRIMTKPQQAFFLESMSDDELTEFERRVAQEKIR